MIRFIEELSMNALPALQTMHIDGWVLRFANGYTRRANSIAPLYPGRLPVEERIALCEKAYQQRGIKVNFKMTPETQPEDLDRILEARGYQVDASTCIQVLDLGGWQPPQGSGARLDSEITDEWLSNYYRMSGIKNEYRPILLQLLRSILAEVCFASVWQAGEVAACGLGVSQAGWVGLYDIVTDPGCRRQGHGQQVVRDLLTWGKNQGAQTAYLQVMENNAPALALYAKMGFRGKYRYWYRGKP
jgi:N-acetylglutamate synthase